MSMGSDGVQKLRLPLPTSGTPLGHLMSNFVPLEPEVSKGLSVTFSLLDGASNTPSNSANDTGQLYVAVPCVMLMRYDAPTGNA